MSNGDFYFGKKKESLMSSKKTKQKKLEHIHIMVSKSEKDFFVRAAETSGLSVAGYLRNAGYEKINRDSKQSLA